MSKPALCLYWCFAGICGCALAAAPESDSSFLARPSSLAEVRFDQKLGSQTPLQLLFRDASGGAATLREFLDGHPAVLVPGYFKCGNVCGVVRASLASAVQRSGLAAGTQFNVLLVSLDPRETTADARAAQLHDASANRNAGVDRWHYLVGAPAATAALFAAVGFQAAWDPSRRQFAHAVGVVVLSPSGIATQYLFGVQFPPETLRLALVNASQGRIGNWGDRLLLLCCDYDPSTGRYGLLIERVMQALGVLTALTLATLVVVLRSRELRAQ